MRFRFIEAEKARYPVRLLCRVLEVSRSGYYAARRRPQSARSRRDRQLGVALRAAHAASRRSYGSPRLHRELLAQGHAVGRHRVARLMREAGLRGRRRRRFRRTTKANPNHPVAANELDRCFRTTAPNQAWVSDISYLWTTEGWLYLAVVIDLYSRRVVGWAMGERIDQALTLRALEMALTGRKPASPCLHHSDRGSQPGFKESSQHYCWRETRYASSASAGVFEPRDLRGRLLSATATASRWSRECLDRSVPLGKY